ncbi:DJ-1/PfpI family protein [Nocardia xishanensis]|uniref:DJ-1/PfpI family protein n=1 Tax=Nocardia xishanensis TaxID=238964 RepID=UPI0033EF3D9B
MTATNSAAGNKGSADQRKVLVVVSAADRIPLREGGSEPTGTYLGELVEPTDAMLAAGFELSFATPGGKIPTIDGTSCSLMYFGMSRRTRDAAMSSYTRLLELGLAKPADLVGLAASPRELADFDAVFVPGGHAPLVDLLYRDAFTDDSRNEDFGALLSYFHEHNRPTALICHAPAALAAAPKVDGRWIYHGYRMTCFKTAVDTMLSAVPVARRFRGHLTVDPTELLRECGARVEQTRLPMGSKIVDDRELLTGQDPYSAKALGAAFVAKVRSSAPVTTGQPA